MMSYETPISEVDRPKFDHADKQMRTLKITELMLEIQTQLKTCNHPPNKSNSFREETNRSQRTEP